MVTTKLQWTILSLGLVFTAFIIGAVWAQVVPAVGEAACGIQSFNVTDNSIDVIFYHKGVVKDTRENGPKADVFFMTGSAIYPNQGGFPFGQHNGNTDVDMNTIRIQEEHNWNEVHDRVARGQSKGWSRTTYLHASGQDFNASDWWVAGVTYTRWRGHQIKAVSQYDISTTPQTFYRSHYRVANTWGNDEFRIPGRYESWPN